MRPLELTEHLHYNEEAKHRKEIINLQSNTNVLLGQISSNQSNVHVNTDGLESLIGTDTSDSPLSLTALTRVQKDIIDSKLNQIASFLDKDNPQFHLKHHSVSSLIGNDSVDGLGNHNHLHVDGSGVAKTSVVNTVNINPANSVNSRHSGNNASLSVGLGARTSINDESSHVHLLSDSLGHLQVDISNQPNFKLEDLSSSLNAQNSSGTSRSIAVGLKGTTNINDVPSGSTFLLCNAQGELVNNNLTKNQDITHASVAVTISSNGVDGEITLNDTDNYVRYMVDGTASLLYVEGSQDNSNFIRLGQVVIQDVGGLSHGSLLIENPPKYLRLKNYDISSIGIKIQAIYGRK